MEIVIVCLAAFLTSLLTFFSGFGLGTLLMPVFALFFPVDISIALTGVVHFSNNLLKLTLVGKNTDRKVFIRFGIPAFIASFAGAWLLIKMSNLPILATYQAGNHTFEISIVNLVIALLLIIFSLLEILPHFRRVEIPENKLVIGGLLSGFFGGLSGIQGAIRSAFLIKSRLSKEAYIATGVAISCLVDISRLSVYTSHFISTNLHENSALIISSVLAAFTGTFIGSRLLHKITMRNIQAFVIILLIVIAIALGSGLL